MKPIKDSLFPKSLFFIYWGILLLMSGIHMGLIILFEKFGFDGIPQTVVILAYWALIALGLTLYTRSQIKRTYEDPMHMLADASKKVASGDFSVYVPTIHTEDKYDYLDVMILNFNKMVEELGSIETLRVDFFSNVSHEIKTPLAIIQNNAQLLARQGLNEKSQEYVNTIEVTVKRLSSLITNILKLNKLEKQTIVPETIKFDFCEHLIQNVLQYETIWEEKNIDFDADITDEMKFFEGDPELLSLVWNNILSNAIKFTGSGGSIKITEYSNDNEIVVSIEDSGCGMSSDTMKHMFEKFYQGDTSHATQGNGLGLALVHRIIQIMNGKISVDSEIGKGTTVTVSFPYKKEKE